MTSAAMAMPEAGLPLPRSRWQACDAAGLAGSLVLHAVAALAIFLLARSEPLPPPPEPLTVELVIEQPAAPKAGRPMVEAAASAEPVPPLATIELPPPVEAPPVIFETPPSPALIELPLPEEVPPVTFEAPPPPPRRKPVAVAIVAPTPAPDPAPAENVARPAAPAAVATAPIPSPIPTPPAAAPAASRYGAILLAWLERYRDYPRQARLRRQEGEVLLRLTIDRMGRLLGAEIARPSGFDLLDRAAIETVRRAAPMPPIPANEPGERLILLVPVVFALAKG